MTLDRPSFPSVWDPPTIARDQEEKTQGPRRLSLQGPHQTWQTGKFTGGSVHGGPRRTESGRPKTSTGQVPITTRIVVAEGQEVDVVFLSDHSRDGVRETLTPVGTSTSS